MRTRTDPIPTEIPFGKCHPFAEGIHRNGSLIIATIASESQREDFAASRLRGAALSSAAAFAIPGEALRL